MATLATGISATDTLLIIAGDVSGVEKGLRFRLDDEICDLAGFDRHVTVAGKRAPGPDRNRWIVERHVGTSAPASHNAGTTVEAVVSASVSGDDLTQPIPFAGTGGDAGPQTVYVQPTDPGAVGAGKLWVDTTTPDGSAQTIRYRGADDDQWFDFFELYSALGDLVLRSPSSIKLRRVSGAVARGEIVFDSSSGRVDITTRNSDGITITTWEVGEDGFGGTVYDELGTARALHLAQGGQSDDADAQWAWTVKDTASADKAKLTLDETGIHLEAVNVILTGLPTSDPAVAGALWLDSGVLSVSAG